MAPRIELFDFRYRDPRSGKWVRARYAATREEIALRNAPGTAPTRLDRTT